MNRKRALNTNHIATIMFTIFAMLILIFTNCSYICLFLYITLSSFASHFWIVFFMKHTCYWTILFSMPGKDVFVRNFGLEVHDFVVSTCKHFSKWYPFLKNTDKVLFLLCSRRTLNTFRVQLTARKRKRKLGWIWYKIIELFFHIFVICLSQHMISWLTTANEIWT